MFMEIILVIQTLVQYTHVLML